MAGAERCLDTIRHQSIETYQRWESCGRGTVVEMLGRWKAVAEMRRHTAAYRTWIAAVIVSTYQGGGAGDAPKSAALDMIKQRSGKLRSPEAHRDIVRAVLPDCLSIEDKAWFQLVDAAAHLLGRPERELTLDPATLEASLGMTVGTISPQTFDRLPGSGLHREKGENWEVLPAGSNYGIKATEPPLDPEAAQSTLETLSPLPTSSPAPSGGNGAGGSPAPQMPRPSQRGRFAPASRRKQKARIALMGPSGSGKTFTALQLAKGLGGDIAFIDTEQRSAENYACLTPFHHFDLTDYSPAAYVAAIREAEQEGFNTVIVDSLSHAWTGPGGVLDMHDKAARRHKGNRFTAWRDVTPEHNQLVESLVRCRCHVIAALRTKTAYEVGRDDKGGMSVQRLGLAPVQRDGVEYEFSLVADLDLDHNLVIRKTRYLGVDFEGGVIRCPGSDLGQRIGQWLDGGEDMARGEYAGRISKALEAFRSVEISAELNTAFEAAKREALTGDPKYGLRLLRGVYATAKGLTI